METYLSCPLVRVFPSRSMVYAFIDKYHAERKHTLGRCLGGGEGNINAYQAWLMSALIVPNLPVLEGDARLTAPNAMPQHELVTPLSHSQYA